VENADARDRAPTGHWLSWANLRKLTPDWRAFSQLQGFAWKIPCCEAKARRLSRCGRRSGCPAAIGMRSHCRRPCRDLEQGGACRRFWGKNFRPPQQPVHQDGRGGLPRTGNQLLRAAHDPGSRAFEPRIEFSYVRKESLSRLVRAPISALGGCARWAMPNQIHAYTAGQSWRRQGRPGWRSIQAQRRNTGGFVETPITARPPFMSP